jgi:hypothetical protein
MSLSCRNLYGKRLEHQRPVHPLIMLALPTVLSRDNVPLKIFS